MRVTLYIFFLFSSLCLAHGSSWASEKLVELSDEEIAWLKQHPNIQLTSHLTQAPFAMVDSAGQPVGIQNDIFKKISDLIGHEIKLYPTREPNSESLINKPDIYGISALIKTPTTKNMYALTDHYMKSSLYIYSNKGNKDKINKASDLSGLRVVVLADNYSQLNYLSGIPDVTIVNADSPLEQLQKLISHEADAALGYSNYPYIIKEYLMTDVSLAFIAVSKIEVHVAVKPEHGILVGILNKAIAQLDEQFLYSVFVKWQEKPIEIGELRLTDEERFYLQNHLFKRASSKNWIPFNYESDNKVVGISEDYWHLIADKLGIKSTLLPPFSFAEILNGLKEKQIDLYPAGSFVKERVDFALFSVPYEQFPIAIATKNDTGYIADASVLIGQKVAVGRDFSSYYLMKDKYPEIDFVFVNNTEEALEQVIENNVFAAIDILPVLQYHIEHVIFGKAKISGITDIQFPLQIMIHRENADLLPIINRAIASITPNERNAIQKKWMQTDIITTTDYKLVWEISIVGGVFILLSLLWNITLRKQIRLRKEAEEKYQRIAITDPLTEIYNRLKLDEVFSYELNRASRYKKEFSIIMIDLDKFKRVNDEFGHLAGDVILKEFTDVIKSNLRNTDTFGRWGGEEFLIISPDSSANSAIKFAEKLRIAIKEYEFSKVKNITASFGLSCFQENDNQASMLGRADDALYYAKENGRDKVVLFPQEREQTKVKLKE